MDLSLLLGIFSYASFSGLVMKLNGLSFIFHCGNSIFCFFCFFFFCFVFFFIFTYLPSRFWAVISKRNTEKLAMALPCFPVVHM